ncbi:MAG: prephenate dehydrogenase/arogenate dehydrogenase family protein [Halopenitus sp.]
MELLVVGAGEIGRWIADTVEADVAFTDRDETVARDAAATAAADDARAVPTDTTETFDAVCLAVPMSAVADAVAEYADNASEAMVDVSGEMATPIAAMREHCPDCQRASFHPLFAPPRVPGNVAVVVDDGGPVVDAICEDVERQGNDVFETTAAEHDDAMETVQAGAHAAIIAWRLAGEDVREEFHTPVSSALDDLADTVTEGSPAVYAEIQRAFEGADDVAEAARDIADADPEEFEALYEQARREGVERDRHD